MPPIPKEQRAEAYRLESDVADRSSQKKRQPTPPTSTTPHQRQGDRGSDAAPRQTVELARDLNFHDRLLTERDAANLLRLSTSWLAKARMRGDGPPYIKLGRSIRYGEGALLQWTKLRVRLSTSER